MSIISKTSNILKSTKDNTWAQLVSSYEDVKSKLVQSGNAFINKENEVLESARAQHDRAVYGDISFPKSDNIQKLTAATVLKLNSQEKTFHVDEYDEYNTATQANSFVAHFRNIKSEAVKAMLVSGADRMKHMFDIMFIVHFTNEKVAYHNLFAAANNTATFEHDDFNAGAFLARARGITVPRPTVDTFTMRVGTDVVEKRRTKLQFEKLLNIPVLMDDKLKYFKLFEALSFGNTDAPRSTIQNGDFDMNSKNIEIDIIVKEEALEKDYSDRRRAERENYNKSTEKIARTLGIEMKNTPLWFFKNVTFLGWADDMQFTTVAGSEPMKNTLRCVFESVDFVDFNEISDVEANIYKSMLKTKFDSGKEISKTVLKADKEKTALNGIKGEK